MLSGQLNPSRQSFSGRRVQWSSGIYQQQSQEQNPSLPDPRSQLTLQMHGNLSNSLMASDGDH